MKRLLPILVSILFCSCSTTKTIPVENIRKDTIYLSNLQYDSIYIYQDNLIDCSRDTLYIKDKSIEFRYKLLKDSVRIVQRDSIPYEIRIVETKQVKYIPPWTKVLAYIGSINILVLLIYKFSKLKRF